jgi:hypothetical protein
MKIILIFLCFILITTENTLEKYLRSLRKENVNEKFNFKKLLNNSNNFNTNQLKVSCPRSWSPEECLRCMPSNHSRCPPGWCPESAGSSCNLSRCPKSHCPYSNSGSNALLCENWGDCCMFGSMSVSSRIGTCPGFDECPKSWSSEQCIINF